MDIFPSTCRTSLELVAEVELVFASSRSNLEMG